MNMTSFSTIPISPNNIAKAIQVFAHAMNFAIDVEQSILDSARMFLTHDNLLGICLTHNDEIVGFGGIISMAGDTAWIPYVGVDPEYQGMGGGRIILENIIQISKRYNWKSLELVASKAGFPVYKRLNFRIDFPVANFEIKSIDLENSKASLDINKISKNDSFPEWLLDFDHSVMGINRSNIFPVHSYENIYVISKTGEGYGMVYGKRIGPIIAKTKELARDIIIEGFKVGGESVIFVNEPDRINFFKQNMLLKMIPETDTTKMTFGEPINYKKEWIYGLRSMAYG